MYKSQKKSKLSMNSINTANEYGNTPLHIAVIAKNIASINTLIKAGADVNAPCSFGRTALHLAIESREVEAIHTLIKAGSDINATYNGGPTALRYAAALGQVDAINILIDAGADINATSNFGRTALHQAATYGQVKAINALIEAGADITIIDNINKAALEYFLETTRESMPFSFLAYSKYQEMPEESVALDQASDVMREQMQLFSQIFKILRCNFFKQDTAHTFPKSIKQLTLDSQNNINNPSYFSEKVITDAISTIIKNNIILTALPLCPKDASDWIGDQSRNNIIDQISEYIMGSTDEDQINCFDLSHNAVPPLSMIILDHISSGALSYEDNQITELLPLGDVQTAGTGSQ